LDLKVECRKVNSEPVYSLQKGIMTISSHLQTYAHAPAQFDNKNIAFSFQKSSSIIFLAPDE
jgi:hypothetical protein